MDRNFYDNDSNNTYYNGSNVTGEMAPTQTNLFTKVFGWMFAGLLITAFFALFTPYSVTLSSLVYNPGSLIILLLIEFGMVIAISAGLNKMSFGAALTCFFIYAAINGLTLSSIFYVYDMGTVYAAFGVTAATFGIMAVYGSLTKRDLSGMGNLLIMCLIGLVTATLVNMFVASDGISWLITYAGVIIFTLLTAYDVQKIKNLSNSGQYNSHKIGIYGALILYLDFINIFLKILRILGGRGRRD